MVGSGGLGSLTTRGSPSKKWVSPLLSQKENFDGGDTTDGTSPPQKEVCWSSKVRYVGSTGAKGPEDVADFSSASTDAVFDSMVSEPHGSALPESDLSRSKNIDAGVTGSGVAGSAVAVSEPAGATSDIAVNAGPGIFSDLLGTAMLCSALAGTEVNRGVAEVIKRSVPSTDSNASIHSAESTGTKISNEIADVASVDTDAGSGGVVLVEAGAVASIVSFNASEISDAAGVLPDVAGKDINGDYGAISDIRGSAILRAIPAGSEKGARAEITEVKTRLGKLNPSKVNPSTAGKTKIDVVAGSGVGRTGPSFKWVRTTHQTHAPGDKISILGLDDKDFPPIRPIRLGARNENWVDGKSKGDTTAVLPSDDAKVSHPWRSLFVTRPKSCSSLAFYNPTKVDGKLTINPPPEAVAEGVSIWEGSLVGQFLDKRLPLHVVRSFVERLWGKHELPEISITDNGLYIFRFRDMVARDWVLENGPWYMSGRPIIIRSWKPGMDMLNVQITSLPIWVKFFNIPLEYWTVTSLGYIASVVGIPMHLDTLTENHSRLSFARICIEVDVNCTFPKSALLDLGNGKYSTIRIEYPWVPQNCTHCKIFGHSHAKCQGVKDMVDTGKTTGMDHIDMRPTQDFVDNADSTPTGRAVKAAENIECLITSPGKVGNVKDTDIQGRLTGNTFECLTMCDDAGNLEAAVDRTIADNSDTTDPNVFSNLSGVGTLDSSNLDLQNIADYSDTSPVCVTFKHIKRIDELDCLPLSKKKLKKLRKREHATKSANRSSSVETTSPYIVDID